MWQIWGFWSECEPHFPGRGARSDQKARKILQNGDLRA